jgi:spore maturation protein SpmA
VLNWVFFGLIVVSTIAAAHLGHMQEVSTATAAQAKSAVDIAIGLIGQMALWLGLMKVLEDAGLLRALARALQPVMKRLFPAIPPEHPAMSAMIMNFAANMAGLTNAATPFGLRAMVELNKLNEKKGIASDAMCLFLAINTSGLAVLPLGAIAMRAAVGAKNLTGIVIPSIASTASACVVAIIATKLLQKSGLFDVSRYEDKTNAPAPTGEQKEKAEHVKAIEEAEAMVKTEHPRPTIDRTLVIGAIIALIVWGFAKQTGDLAEPVTVFSVIKEFLEHWFLPILVLAIVLFGFARRVRVYESVIAGAKEGFNIAVMIIPFMVAILVAIGMFRASGAMDLTVRFLGPITSAVGFPAEALPMAILKPLSGSGSLAVMVETMKTYGPDSFVGFLVSVLNGSFETTFYVLAVYFGSVGIRVTRHTVLACLCSDFVGIVMATVFSRLFY